MPDSHEITRPYPGLRPFESWEGEIFFGREEHTNRLLDILKERYFLAVIGPSGSGKSSLVRAGLLPSLPLGSLGTGSDWRIAIMRPGNRPIRSLTHALLARSTLGIELLGEEHIPRDESDMTPDVALIEADLRRGPLGLIDIVQDARTRHTGKDPFNLLVLVDQFEELFTYAEAGGRKADEAEAFVNLLLAPQTVPDAQIYIVLTMRTDFLGNCMHFLELPDAINRAQYLTPRLTREQIERAITSPAFLFDGDVEPTLVTELINTVSDDPDQLPILQHALSRMWDEASQRQSKSPCISWNDFNTVGGITNALSRHADEILASLSLRNQIEQPFCPEQLAAVDLFRAITEQRSAEAGGQAVRRPQSLARIAQWSGRNWQDFKPVIDAYAREGVNFLHINSSLNNDTIVDISHEALIRQWQRLRDWVSQEARLASEYKRFRRLAEDFKTGSGALLTGAALARALEWQKDTFSKGSNNDSWQPNANWADRYSKNKEVQPNTEFNEVLKFIDDSHAVVLNEARRARKLNRALSALTALSVLATIGAIGFAIKSSALAIKSSELAKQSIIQENILWANSLWVPLDFNCSPIINVTEKQAEGLLKLESADVHLKQIFFGRLSDLGMKDPESAVRFINNPEVIMTAMVGINPVQKNKLLNLLKEPPDKDSNIFRLTRSLILSELGEGAKISSNDILSAIALKDKDSEVLISQIILDQRIKTLIGKMDKTNLEKLSERILDSFNDPAIDNEFEFETRAEAIAAIIERIPPQEMLDKDKIADQLIAAIKAANNPLQLVTLQRSLVSVATKITKMQDEQLADELADKLSSALEAPLVPGQIEVFWKGMEILAPKLSANLAQNLAEQLVNLIKDSSNPYPFKTLGQTLVSVVPKMPEQDLLAGKFSDQLFTAMKQSKVPEQFDTLGQGLAEIVTKIPASKLVPLAKQFINAITIKINIKHHSQFCTIGEELQEDDFHRYRALGLAKPLIDAITIKNKTNTKHHSQFCIIGEGLQEDDLDRYRTLGQSLAAIIKMMPEKQAKKLADTLFSEIMNSDIKKPLDPGQFNALGQGLAEATAKLTQDQADIFAKGKLMPALYQVKDAKDSSKQFSALVEGMTGISKQLSEKKAYELAVQFIKLLRELEKKQSYVRFEVLGNGLAELAAKVSKDDARKLTGQIIAATMASEKNRMQTMAFGPGVAKAAAKIPAPEIVKEKEMGSIISLFKTSNDTQLKVYVKALEAIVNNLPEDKTLALVDSLIAVINGLVKEPKDVYRSKIKTLGKGLKAVTAKVPDNQVEKLTNQLIAEIKASSDPDKNEALGQGLAAAYTKTTPRGAIDLADKLLTAMNSTSPSQFKALGQGLSVVIEKLPESRQTLAKQLLEIILQTQNPSQLEVQGEVLKVITAELKPDHETLVHWFELLKNPLTPRKILASAICQQLSCNPKENQGVWNLIEWAKQHYPDIDLEAPLKDSVIL